MDPPGGSIQSQPHQSRYQDTSDRPTTSDTGAIHGGWIHPRSRGLWIGLIHRGTGLIHHRWI
eukprot:3792408-Prymnesium_polylepis.1